MTDNITDTDIEAEEDVGTQSDGIDPTELPDRYMREIGSMHIQKGSDATGTKQIISWEIAKPCRGERCPAAELCTYTRGARCRVENTYLRAVSNTIYQNYITILDEPTLMRVGLHLMPIYQNLCRLKLVEAGIEDPVVSDAKGKLSIHPVYKEMREHIKLLEQTWRSLGLTEYYMEAELPGDLEFGDDIAPTVKARKMKKSIVRRPVVVEGD